MANDYSFKDTMNNWMDKAEGFLDDLMDNSRDHRETVSTHTRQLDNLARASKEDLKEEARQARRNLQDQSREISDRLDGWLDELKERARRTGDVSEEQLARFKSKVRRFQQQVRNNADLTADDIKSRYDHFTDGLDRIRRDIKENEAAGNRRVNDTSPITEHGDYRAANFDGTLNNYADRMQTHTEKTKERIRQEADQAAAEMREQAAEFGIESK